MAGIRRIRMPKTFWATLLLVALVLIAAVARDFSPSASALTVFEKIAASARDPATYFLLVAGLILLTAVGATVRLFDPNSCMPGIAADLDQRSKRSFIRSRERMYLATIVLVFLAAAMLIVIIGFLVIALKTPAPAQAATGLTIPCLPV